MNELTFFDSLFDILGDNSYKAMNTPSVDVLEEEKAYTLEMELPGRTENDVNIELDKDNLTIESKKKENTENKEQKFILQERRKSDFSRKFKLPADVDKDSISANFKNGILTIYMQKKPESAPKKIAILAS